MIKRIPAFLFILLANIALLANVVIPHHHHKKEVCIVSSHCEPDSKTHEHDKSEQNHKHDKANNVDDCVLKLVLSTPPNQLNQEIERLDRESSFPLDYLQAVLFDNRINGLYITGFSKKQPPLILLKYPKYASTGLSLRGPPIA